MSDSLSRRVKRGDLFSEHCASRDVLKHVTSRWAMLLLVALRNGADGDARRFAALRRKVEGISERMLAQTLVWLEYDGLVQRVVHSVVPPHVEYRLTPLGEDIAARVAELVGWIESNLDGIAQAQRQADARQAKSPLDGTSQGASKGVVLRTGAAGGLL